MDMKTPTLGQLIDKLHAVRTKRQALADQDKPLEKEEGEIRKSIIAELLAQQTDEGKSKKLKVSLTYSTVANVKDWDAFWDFILKGKGKYNHLLQRRVSDPAYRELLQLAQNDKRLATALSKAGVESFETPKLNIRTL
jgi:hypothetical protein